MNSGLQKIPLEQIAAARHDDFAGEREARCDGINRFSYLLLLLCHLFVVSFVEGCRPDASFWVCFRRVFAPRSASTVSRLLINLFSIAFFRKVFPGVAGASGKTVDGD